MKQLLTLSIFGFFALSAPASAQSFREIAENAEEAGELSRFGGALFEDCDDDLCRGRAEREASALRAGRWLVSVPAAGNVEVGPYERVRQGFLVRIPSLRLHADGGRLVSGDLSGPRETHAERFFAVPPERSAAWFAQNAISRLRVRAVIRIGESYQVDGRDVARIEVEAVELFNNGTGAWLVDSARPTALPEGGPVNLDVHVRLWDANAQGEARWHAPNGEALIFSVRRDGRVVTLVETRGVTTRDVHSFENIQLREAGLALRPRGENEVLVIFTRRRPGRNHPGSGSVILLRWHAQSLVPVLVWNGDNGQPMPAWVLDADAPTPGAAIPE